MNGAKRFLSELRRRGHGDAAADGGLQRGGLAFDAGPVGCGAGEGNPGGHGVRAERPERAAATGKNSGLRARIDTNRAAG